MRVPVPVTEIVHALEREAGNTDTDPRWLAASELRRMTGYETRTLMCVVDERPSVSVAPILEIECSANRGREYKVTFDAVGSTQRVEVKVWQANGLRKYTWRRLWRDDGRQSMTATVSCAIHAAQAQIERMRAV